MASPRQGLFPLLLYLYIFNCSTFLSISVWQFFAGTGPINWFENHFFRQTTGPFPPDYSRLGGGAGLLLSECNCTNKYSIFLKSAPKVFPASRRELCKMAGIHKRTKKGNKGDRIVFSPLKQMCRIQFFITTD